MIKKSFYKFAKIISVFDFKVNSAAIVLTCLSLFACQNSQIKDHSNYFSLDLSQKEFNDLQNNFKKELTKISASKPEVISQIKNRGEAHITIVTPPEWKILSQKVSNQEAEKLIRGLKKNDYKIICLGQGKYFDTKTNKELKNYFYVVDFPKAIESRKAIASLYKSRGGDKDFEAEHFYPHITLGFTDRDLHEQDGVIKNTSSCIEKINN